MVVLQQHVKCHYSRADRFGDLSVFDFFRAASGPFGQQQKGPPASLFKLRDFCRRRAFARVVGLGGNIGQVNYASAKAGIVGMTMTLAKEWGRLKVNVNCVACGFIMTRLTEAYAAGDATIKIGDRAIKVGLNPDSIKVFEPSTPLGRAGNPEEAAACHGRCRRR